MRSLKNHISLIIPLFAILFAMEFYLIIDRVIKQYESRLSDDYSIVVVSNEALELERLKKRVPKTANIEEINASVVIERLKKEGMQIDFKQLEQFMPKFYRVRLESFPTTDELAELKKRYQKIKGVERVETFVRSHEQIYRFLLFVKRISKLFLAIIFVTSVMLVFKQIEVWILEHQERMYIMALFGAPLWMRTAMLIKLSVIDTIISALLVYGIYYYLITSGLFSQLLGIESPGVDPKQLLYDMWLLMAAGLAISLVNIIIVSSRQQRGGR